MKRKLLLLSCLFAMGVAFGQDHKPVGVGALLPDPSAVLHAESSNQGVLIPNVVLTNINEKTPIATEAKESLLVYNKEDKKDVGGKVVIAKGYYYWVVTTPAVGATPAVGRWVRVLTSEDGSEILAGQIQEYFVEKQSERDMPKINQTTGKLDRDKDGNVIMEKRLVGGTYVYVGDKTKIDDANYTNRLTIDVPSLVKEQETVTTFKVSQFELYHYTDGRKLREKLKKEESDDIGIFLVKTTKELELVYSDEKGEMHNFAIRDLLGADNEDVPAITSLKTDDSNIGLIYTNDKGVQETISLLEVVKKNETPTTIVVDGNDNLIFTNERGAKQQVSMRSVVKEPWYTAEDNLEATLNTQNIFTQGWVGIGLKAGEAKNAIGDLKPDEKLRVNGSIYARNSYYADYVFENYFTKESSTLKYDYKFKDLATVESFIKANYHLPGITPVAELEKSKDSGYLINISELSIQLLEKVEELYLHTIDQQKVINEQKLKLDMQEKRLQEIETMLNIGKEEDYEK